jgi:hypothetical protein
LDVEAYSQKDAEARVVALLKKAAIGNGSNWFLAGFAILTSMVFTTVEEVMEKIELRKAKQDEKQKESVLCQIASQYHLKRKV